MTIFLGNAGEEMLLRKACYYSQRVDHILNNVFLEFRQSDPFWFCHGSGVVAACEGISFITARPYMKVCEDLFFFLDNSLFVC